MMRLITGTGRCGTAYMAEILRRAGVNAGHEQVFTPQRMASCDSSILDVSAWALPWLCDGNVNVNIAHQVRHPFHVMRSFLRMGFYTNPPSPCDDISAQAMVYRELPHLRDLPPMEAAARHWIDWNAMLRPLADVTWRIEDIAPVDIADWTGASLVKIADAMNVVPKTLHHWNHGIEVGDVELTATTHEELQHAAATYGYKGV